MDNIKSIENKQITTPQSNAKKAGPTILPKGISTKADNKLTNTRPGPAPGSKPYANIIGKIARPANIAINVSKPATVREVLKIFSSCGMYEP